MGDEYHEYMKRVADKYAITEHITFSTAVIGCEWSEDRQRWLVRTSTNGGDGQEHEAATVVTAMGFLNRPNIPEIPGHDTFKGPVVHSAQWDSASTLPASESFCSEPAVPPCRSPKPWRPK